MRYEGRIGDGLKDGMGGLLWGEFAGLGSWIFWRGDNGIMDLNLCVVVVSDVLCCETVYTWLW